MLIVDGITSVGVFEQKMDAWGVDAFVTGSQKALMLPPGLGMVALSSRAIDVAKNNKTPRFYFDLLKELKAQRDEHTTAWTAAVSLIFGLNKSLELIHAEGLPQVYARHAVMAESTRDAAAALKLKLLAPDNPAPGVTGILVPEGLDGGKLVKYLRDNLGVSVQGGQDQMKGKLVRIGHMGSSESIRHADCGERARTGPQANRRKHSTGRRRRRGAGAPSTERLKQHGGNFPRPPKRLACGAGD